MLRDGWDLESTSEQEPEPEDVQEPGEDLEETPEEGQKLNLKE
jgi:hypothetical protein